MSTKSFSITSSPSLLAKALRANAVFSLISGLILVFDAGILADLFNVQATLPLTILGSLLVLHACMLFFSTIGKETSSRVGWYAVIGDVIWVAASIDVLLFDPFHISTTGKWIVLVIADIVAIFAFVQFLGIRRQR